MSTEKVYDGEAEKTRLVKLRDDKRAELLAAIVDLETAAWARRWTDLKAARARIEAVTGLKVVGPLRAALEQARRAERG